MFLTQIFEKSKNAVFKEHLRETASAVSGKFRSVFVLCHLFFITTSLYNISPISNC